MYPKSCLSFAYTSCIIVLGIILIGDIVPGVTAAKWMRRNKWGSQLPSWMRANEPQPPAPLPDMSLWWNKLDDDSLKHILDHLSTEDQLNLARSHRDINLDFRTNIHPWGIQDVTELEKLCGKENRKEILLFIAGDPSSNGLLTFKVGRLTRVDKIPRCFKKISELQERMQPTKFEKMQAQIIVMNPAKLEPIAELGLFRQTFASVNVFRLEVDVIELHDHRITSLETIFKESIDLTQIELRARYAQFVDSWSPVSAFTALKANSQKLERLGIHLPEELDVWTEDLPYQSISHIVAQLVASSRTLTHLDLSDCELGNHQVTEISHAIKSHPSLRYLDLSGKNKIAHTGIDALGDALRENTVLQHITLPEVWAPDVLFHALAVQKTVKSIKFSWPYIIRPVTVTSIMELANHLDRLELEGRIDGSMFDVFTEALKTSNLKNLSLKLKNSARNPFTAVLNRYAIQLAGALKENTHLRGLTVSKMKIGNEAATVIASALEDNHSLEILDLEENFFMGNKAALTLVRAYGTSNTLKHLSLPTRFVNAGTMQALEDIRRMKGLSL